MSYYYGNTEAYSPDKKDLALARRLASNNPSAGANQIFSIDGRQFISRISSSPGGPNRVGDVYSTSFERYFPKPAATAPVPAPQAAAAPAPKPQPAPTTTPTNQYQSQISDLTNQLSINQTALDKALANAATTKTSYDNLIKNLKIDFGNQIKNLQSNYVTETQKLIDSYGLQISGLKSGFNTQYANQQSAFDKKYANQQAAFDTRFANQQTAFDTQFAAQAADFKTRFEGQEASFVERLTRQQRGFDVSMANQAIAGRAANLQIGSDQTSAPQQGGTGDFRRRALQFNTPAYAGLSINSGNINI